MNEFSQIIGHLLESEEEEDFDLKDITEPELVGGPATVKRYGRTKEVDTPQYTFFISYLTPVGYYDKTFGNYYRTTKHYSPTTEKHINDWQSRIWKSPAWQNDQRNWEPSEVPGGSHWVRYPRLKTRPQASITALLRKVLPLLTMKPHQKRRMYHVDPKMRQGSRGGGQWLSGHLKHHDSGDEGLPRPNDREFAKFFKDFDPDEPEIWDWSSGLRNVDPRERYAPDEP